MTDAGPSRDSVGMSAASPAQPADADVSWVVAAYREHFRYIYALVGRLGVPPALVEDLTQEVFLVLHRRRDEFRGESSVKTWLHGIAVHIARRRREQLRRRERRDSELGEVAAPVSPESELDRRQALRTLDQLLEHLADEQREVFVLIEVSGCSAPEVSEILGINLNTVYSRLRLARSRLQRALDALRARGGL